MSVLILSVSYVLQHELENIVVTKPTNKIPKQERLFICSMVNELHLAFIWSIFYNKLYGIIRTCHKIEHFRAQQSNYYYKNNYYLFIKICFRSSVHFTSILTISCLSKRSINCINIFLFPILYLRFIYSRF